MPCVPLLYFPDLSQPALLSSEQKHGWRSTIQMQRTRESFPFSCAVTTKRSSRETAGSAKESILFRNTIGHRLSYRHSKRGSRFCSRWPRVKWGNLRVTARARSQSARHADPRGMERIQMPSIILDEYTIFVNEVNISAINSSDISV